MLERATTPRPVTSGGAHLHEKAHKRHGSPEAITTDGLRSYGAAMTELGCREKQEWAAGRTTGREQPPAVPTTRAGDAAVQADEDAQKFASVHATSTTTSASNATSSTARPTRNDAPPRGGCGGSSQARLLPSKTQMHPVESGSR